MKQLIWILFILILFLGVGFLYVVKNPETPVSKKILQTVGISPINTLPTEPTTEIDLTNCISYFDGCNRCSVQNGQLIACTEMHCEPRGEPKCLKYSNGSTTNNNGSIGLANPASVNCEKKGGTSSIVTSAGGGQVGMCSFPDGSVCEERAYMRGECLPGDVDQGISSPDSEGLVGNTPVGDEQKVCIMVYAPVCALVHIQCVKEPCNPVKQTFGNRCMMDANPLAEYLYDGECTTK